MLKKRVTCSLIVLSILFLVASSMVIEGNALVNASPNSDGWLMSRHDLQHTGSSTSYAPNSSNLMWIFNTTASEVVTCPAVDDGKVIFSASNGNVYALNSNTGQQIWMRVTANRENSMWSSPAVDSGQVYVGARDYYLYCLSETTGSILWSFKANYEIDCSPIATGGRVFFITTNGTMYCLNSVSGSLLWSNSFLLHNSIDEPAIAMINENTLVINNGNVYALNAANGAFNWSYQAVYAQNSPVVADGKVFGATGNNTVFCLDAASGLKIWSTTILYSSMLDRSSPAFADGRLFVGSCNCLNASTGSLLWNTPLQGFEDLSSPAVADGKVFLGESDGKLYCLKETTGEILWNCTTGESIRSSPAIAYGNVYVGSDSSSSSPSSHGSIYAFGSNPVIPTYLTLSLNSQTSLLGFNVNLNGTVTGNQSALINVPVELSFSINGGQTWTDITSVSTLNDGSYSAIWIPSATGTFLVRALCEGVYPFLSSQTMMDLSVAPYNNQYVFSVSSNSSVSALAFDSTSNTLNFTVSGPAGTTGFVDLKIAKSLLENIANLKVNLDSNNLAYQATSTSDSWILEFHYSHSIHNVNINMGSALTPTPTQTSNTSTPTPKPTPTPAPTPVAPEFSLLVILPLLASVLVIAVAIKRHERLSTQ